MGGETLRTSRASGLCGRFTKLALSRDVFALAGVRGSMLMQRCLDAEIVRLAGLHVVLPERIYRPAGCVAAPIQVSST